MSVLDEEELSVHSVVFLHSPDAGHTAMCLATQLAQTFACQRRKSTKFITIRPNEINSEGDYGEVLER